MQGIELLTAHLRTSRSGSFSYYIQFLHEMINNLLEALNTEQKNQYYHDNKGVINVVLTHFMPLVSFDTP